MIGFFEEKEGQRSATRLVFIIGMMWLMAISSFIVYLKAYHGLEVSWTEITMMFSAISTILYGAKLIQKEQEKPAVTPTP